MWKLAKWAKNSDSPIQPPQMPTLTHNNEQFTTNEAKTEVLRTVLFLMPEPIDTSDIEGTAYPEPIDMACEITEEEIQKVVRKLPNDKAPGLDEIPNRCIKKCLA